MQPKVNQKIWVVVPAFNEESRIGEVLRGLCQNPFQIVVVDDCSTDGTSVEVHKYPVVSLQHSQNLGQGAAIQTGIEYALLMGAQQIITFDSDGQHDSSDIAKLLFQMQSCDCDFALGSRFLGKAIGMPPMRRLLLKAAILFTGLQIGSKFSDTHNGLRAMTRKGAEHLNITMNRMEHASQILSQIVSSGLDYIEVPVTITYTKESLAKGQKNTDALKLGFTLIFHHIHNWIYKLFLELRRIFTNLSGSQSSLSRLFQLLCVAVYAFLFVVIAQPHKNINIFHKLGIRTSVGLLISFVVAPQFLFALILQKKIENLQLALTRAIRKYAIANSFKGLDFQIQEPKVAMRNLPGEIQTILERN